MAPILGAILADDELASRLSEGARRVWSSRYSLASFQGRLHAWVDGWAREPR
jgi:hypothetical protein